MKSEIDMKVNELPYLTRKELIQFGEKASIPAGFCFKYSWPPRMLKEFIIQVDAKSNCRMTKLVLGKDGGPWPIWMECTEAFWELADKGSHRDRDEGCCP